MNYDLQHMLKCREARDEIFEWTRKSDAEVLAIINAADAQIHALTSAVGANWQLVTTPQEYRLNVICGLQEKMRFHSNEWLKHKHSVDLDNIALSYVVRNQGD